MDIFVIVAAVASVVVIGVMVALLIGLMALLIIACVRRSWKFALWSFAWTLTAMGVVLGLYLGMAYWLFGPSDLTSASALSEAYKFDFGALPPAGVTVLKARQVGLGDSVGQWLLLKATPHEIERLIAMGFTKPERTPRDFAGKGKGNAPRWWKPPTERLEIYEIENWRTDGGWHRSKAAIGIDKASNLIWYSSSKSS